jgi:hypothetical protein
MELADKTSSFKVLHPLVIEQDWRISPSSPVFTPMLVSFKNDWLQLWKNFS